MALESPDNCHSTVWDSGISYLGEQFILAYRPRLDQTAILGTLVVNGLTISLFALFDDAQR